MVNNGDWIGEKNPNWKGGKPGCPICGNILSHYYKRKCRKCYRESLKNPENTPYYGKRVSEERKEKLRTDRIGQKSVRWKGGKFKTSDGYIYVYKPEHPRNLNNYIAQHRLVMEEFLGRYLKPSEIVHHINEIRDDNRLENLLLIRNRSEHTRLHNLLNDFAKKGFYDYRERIAFMLLMYRVLGLELPKLNYIEN